MIRLDPGQSNEDFLILNNLFDLSKPGKYTVTVGHGLRVDVPGSDPNLMNVPSNTITITVTE